MPKCLNSHYSWISLLKILNLCLDKGDIVKYFNLTAKTFRHPPFPRYITEFYWSQCVVHSKMEDVQMKEGGCRILSSITLLKN